jgi:fumarate hydratase subunit beta
MKIKINLPADKEEIRKLKIGDMIYLNGILYTFRDEGHIRALKNKKIPVSLKNSAIFHCGPIMNKTNSGWKIIAAGPTTSARMNTLEPKFIEIFRPGFIIGKGGMNKKTKNVMKKYGCVYLSMTGGAATLGAKMLNVKDVYWYELGMPEALWVLEAKSFGPLIVAIDVHGNSLYENVEKNVEKNIVRVRKKLGL